LQFLNIRISMRHGGNYQKKVTGFTFKHSCPLTSLDN
jgi:hypothetical protein